MKIRFRSLKWALIGAYWKMVKSFSRRAYLTHVVESAPEAWEVEAENSELLAMETKSWTDRGIRVHLWIKDVPLSEGETSHWHEDQYGSYVGWNTLRKFKRLVEDAEYERAKRKREGREMWVKWFTAIVAAVAAVASLMTLYFTYRPKK